MFKLDNAFLEELGLGSLPAVEKNKMLAHIYETLEMRVGMKLAEQMSNEQLDEFESYINKQDESGALKWLETNFPNYKQVVAEELDKLKGEISQVAPQIVSQSQANASQQPAAPIEQNQAPAQTTQPQQPLQSPPPPPQQPQQPAQFQQAPQQPQFQQPHQPPQTEPTNTSPNVMQQQPTMSQQQFQQPAQSTQQPPVNSTQQQYAQNQIIENQPSNQPVSNTPPQQVSDQQTSPQQQDQQNPSQPWQPGQ